jgi:hypothetical protein
MLFSLHAIERHAHDCVDVPALQAHASAFHSGNDEDFVGRFALAPHRDNRHALEGFVRLTDYHLWPCEWDRWIRCHRCRRPFRARTTTGWLLPVVVLAVA